MLTIYRLRADKDFIAQVQKATTTSEEFGIEPTHGLFGSSEWWHHVSDGTLPVQTLRGAITRVYMGSMNDWPELTMRTETGEESSVVMLCERPSFHIALHGWTSDRARLRCPEALPSLFR